METSDEIYAAELQRKFSEDERRQREMEEEDTKLALALSLGHEISGSEDEEEVQIKQYETRTHKQSPLSGALETSFVKDSKSRNSDSRRVVKKSILEISDSDPDDTQPSSSGLNADDRNERACSSNQSILHGSYKIPKKGQKSSSNSPKASYQTGSNKQSPRKNVKEDEKKDMRPHCEYGRRCYRKNPIHRQEFYHSDSGSEEELTNPKAKKRKKTNNDVEQGESSSKRMKDLNNQHSSISDVLQAATPFSFFMSKVTGIPSKYNNEAVHISEILSPEMGDLEASVQFNYMHDIPWLIQQYHPKFRSKPLLLVHGEQRESKNALHEEASSYPNIRLCQARLDIMYGTHHSKMMILLYKNGLRVVIHTANLIHSDWHQKSQGVWISPLFSKLNHDSPTPQMGNSTTNFKVDLLEYIAAYKTKGLSEWQEHILQHDMSEARVHIIGSVPGRHQGESKMKWGHLKLRNILKEHANSQVKNWSIVGQFSSVGSLGPDKCKWLCGEWLESLSSTPSGKTSNPSLLKLIFPSVDNVRLSLEGYPAGASLPYSARTAVKQQYFNQFLHQWCSSVRGRSRASPHIKTYARVSPDQSKISWFIVTSANLSKAAWGALEKKETQLMIRSYEIGVLFLPKDFNPSSEGYFVAGNTSDNDVLYFPLPWDLPLKPYEAKDSPWVWDVAHAEKPDSHGNAWIPS